MTVGVFFEQWVREMRELLAEIMAQDFGYPIGVQEIGPPAREIPSAVPAALHPMYRAFDGLSMSGVHNGYFIDAADRVAIAGERKLPIRLGGDPQHSIRVFGSDGGGGLFAVGTKNGAVYYLPEGGGVEDRAFHEDEWVRARLIADDIRVFLCLLTRDVRAFMKCWERHRFITDWVTPIDRAMTEEFMSAIRDAIQRRLDLHEILPILRGFRDRGLTAKAAEQLLVGMLDHSEDEFDRIADIGDIVAGWCAPHLRVWPDR